MTMENRRSADFWTLVRGLALVAGTAVLALSAVCWGRTGLMSAALGTALSIVNVWAMGRIATRALQAVSALGPRTATVQLTAALGAKTVMLLSLIWFATRTAEVALLPLALGLMVSVFSLLGAGVSVALRGK
jgi:hypothetical protein